MNVSVGKEFEEFVRLKVDSGDYASVSEVVRDGFLSMPDLCVTEAHARLLWSLDAETGVAVLDTLCSEGFLIRTGDGMFKRPQQAPSR